MSSKLAARERHFCSSYDEPLIERRRRREGNLGQEVERGLVDRLVGVGRAVEADGQPGQRLGRPGVVGPLGLGLRRLDRRLQGVVRFLPAAVVLFDESHELGVDRNRRRRGGWSCPGA